MSITPKRYIPFTLTALFLGALCSTGCEKSQPETPALETEKAISTNVEPDVAEALDSGALDPNIDKNRARFCDAIESSKFQGEVLDGQAYFITQLKEFKRSNRVIPKFSGVAYPAGLDFDADGTNDFYLTLPGYNHSSYQKDYTELYILFGKRKESGEAVPNFARKALKRMLFSSLNKRDFKPRNPPNVDTEGDFIMTAKVTPIKFNSDVYFKIDAQLATAINPVYRSSYTTAPDWTTFAKFNHNLDLEDVCP